MTENSAAQLSDSDARLWATLAHVGTIFFTFLPALIIWLVQKEKSAFVETESKEALNFAILIAASYIVGSILSVILIGVVLIFAAWVLSLIFCIQGAIKANKGQNYRYPLNVRLIK